MTVYTQKQAQQDLDSVLEDASMQGEVRIRRGDGQEFVLKPLAEAPHEPQQLCSERQRDLSDLSGTWVDDPAFDRAIADQRTIDPELWK